MRIRQDWAAGFEPLHLRIGIRQALWDRAQSPRQLTEHSIETKPTPVIERKVIFTVVNGRWLEGGEVHTVGCFREVALPVEVARAAVRHRHGLEIDNPQVAILREHNPPDYAMIPADITVDLLQPAVVGAPKYFDADGTRVAALVVHSAIEAERIGPARTFAVDRNPF